MKHVFAAAMIAVLCLSAGCDDATGSNSRPVSTVAIAGDSAGLAVGGARQMTAVPLALDGDTLRDRAVVWSSADSTVAGVSADGLVTARAVGSVTIRATIEGQSGETELTVIPQGFSGKWSSVSVGTARTCALAEGEVAYCWGQRLAPAPAPGLDSIGVPTRVPGPQTFTQVSTASVVITTSPFFKTATCGLASDGAAYCWGGTSSGNQVGAPRRVSSPSLTTWSTDLDFACGLTYEGEPYCWGDGLEITSPGGGGSAVRVMPTIHLTSLALGSGMACGIDTAGATRCVHRRFLYRSAASPFADDFASIAVGSGFRCGLRSDGEPLCSTRAIWGTGGSWSMYSDLAPVHVPDPLAQLSAGGSRVCGLTVDGMAYCWKVEVDTSMGAPGHITTPAAVGREHHFVQISAADTHACGVTADGEIYCWGDNGAGELGNGSIGGSSDMPVRVSNPA